MANKYTSQAPGVPGNDDFGTMSAWFVFAGLGLYPLPSTTRYFVGSPLFSNAVIQPFDRSLGKIQIIAHYSTGTDDNNDDTNGDEVYVKKLEVNGDAVDLANSPFVEHHDLARAEGAVLEFWMTSTEPTYSYRYRV